MSTPGKLIPAHSCPGVLHADVVQIASTAARLRVALRELQQSGASGAYFLLVLTRVTRSPAAGRFGGLQTLQESFFFAGAGRLCRPARAKQADLRGRQVAPKPPPRKSCY